MRKKSRKMKVNQEIFRDLGYMNADYHSNSNFEMDLPYKNNKSIKFEPQTEAQFHYFFMMDANIITFGLGIAGTGKSYCAAFYAAEQLQKKKIKKIIITRPAVECGEKFGFLPGDLEEKYQEYLTPLLSIFYKAFGKSYTDYLIKNKTIEAKPLGFMRGSTFEDCIVIADEMQNANQQSFLMFLSRIGSNCKVIINGDINQSDIRGQSGLEDAAKRLRYIRNVGIIEFGIDDIVRSDIVRDIIIAYQ